MPYRQSGMSIVKTIKYCLWGLLLSLSGLWLLADTLLPQPFTYFALRAQLMQYTGVLAIGAMSAAILLAARPQWLEPHLHGLDKMYRLHKWLGIGALVVSVVHWWWAQGTKWMVGWGWLTRPLRRRAGPGGPPQDVLEAWLRGQRGLAESLGEWAFYAAAALITLALIKRFPYHLFVKTHKLLAVTYLLLAYHSLVLFKFGYWSQPVGWAMALLLFAGSAAALLVLAGRVGAGRKVRGVVESLCQYPELQVLETAIQLQPGWRGHKAGQFAFVTSHRDEGAHPYTIASAWNPATRRIVFITKALGDHTSQLPKLLQTGTPVTVEGPYGCFDFDDRKPRQIWIGAGIGITPFISRMQQLAQAGGAATGQIDLFHPTAEFSQAAIDKLSADARAANVRLHILVSGKDGRLDGAQIRTAVPDWQAASVWFCGPPAFGRALSRDLVAHGLAERHFHQELFQMR